MPGTEVLVETISGPSPRNRAPGSTYFVGGQTERGPIDEAILVRSMAELERLCGPRVTYGAIADDLAQYFGEGGPRAYVARTVGPAALPASSTLVDRAVAPLDTVTLEAKNPGAWGNTLTRQVANGVALNSVTITISGTPDGTDEVFEDLANPAAIVAAINAGSRWVTATNEGSATVAPNNNPAVSAATALAGGTDDRASIVTQDYLDAVDALFGEDLGAGAIAIPGQPSSAVGSGLLAHADERNRIAILATTSGQTPTAAETAAAAQAGVTGAEAGGLYYPWTKIAVGGGLTRTISPEGYVAAARARAHNQTGPWRAGAGEISRAKGIVVGLEREIDKATGDELNAARVNALRTIGKNVQVYGVRSLSSNEIDWKFLTYRDFINDLVVEAKARLESSNFAVIDGQLNVFKAAEGIVLGILQPYVTAGGIFPRRDPDTGEVLDRGYVVDTGPGVNTPETILEGAIVVEFGVRPSPTAEIVRAIVRKAGLTAAL